MEMNGIKQLPTLTEIVINDADVVELIVNPKIKRLIV